MKQNNVSKNPLIIFSDDSSHGEYISLLLSNHLQFYPDSHFKSFPHSLEENYFCNKSLSQCIDLFNKQLIHEEIFVAQLYVLLQEGQSNNRLVGISLPISAFHAIRNSNYFSSSGYLYVYEELSHVQTPSLIANNDDINYIKLNPSKCITIASKFLFAYPDLIAQKLSDHLQIQITDQGKRHAVTQGFTMNYSTESNTKYNDAEKNILYNADILKNSGNHFAGNEYSIIYYSINIESKDDLLKRLQQIYICFFYPPKYHILCEDDSTIEFYTAFLRPYEYLYSALNFHLKNEQAAKQFNQIIDNTESKFLLIDDINSSYNIPAFINKFENLDENSICYGQISQHQFIRYVGLKDVIEKDYPEHNLLFNKKVWQTLQGFDTTLDNSVILWDFVIRSLDYHKNKVCISSISKVHFSQTEFSVDKQNRLFSAHQNVLEKHKKSLQDSISEQMEISHNENYHLHQENKILYDKINEFERNTAHADEELKSLQELSTQLQDRIQQLENNWYQKFRFHFGRVKKIFFKKKSPGTKSASRIGQFMRFTFSKPGAHIARKISAQVLKKLYTSVESRKTEIVYLDDSDGNNIFTYKDWIKNKLNLTLIHEDYELLEPTLAYKPLISILMPVYNTPINYLTDALESVLNQVYTNWELCIVDDMSTNERVRKILHVYSIKDERIKVHYRTENGHISASSNDAFAMAKGDFIMLMDHDDLITEHCLWEIVKEINLHPDAEIIYSDEDKVDDENLFQEPHFKPGWSPDRLLSLNYICHVTVLKKSLMDKIGGFRLGFEGSQDYDLLLRASEQTTHIYHIPKILYHWRIHALSAAQVAYVKPYAYMAAKKALEEALQRRNLNGQVSYLTGLVGYKISYDVANEDLVSIIIPTKDQTALLKNTIDSLIAITSYKNFEIIVLNNNSSSKEFYEWADEYSKKYPQYIRIIEAHFPFNFSKLMNIGVGLAKGEHILFLNNDVEIIHSDWLHIMVSYSQQKRIGAVGVKLLYPDDTVQHAGVIVGLGGIAGHCFVGAYKDEGGYFSYIQTANNFSAVTAACLMCRKEVFEQVGGMNEGFEVEYNDVDFCLKIMEAGYNNVYVPQVELYHYESATRGHPHQSKPSYERHLREMQLFKDTWQHIIDHEPFYNPNLTLTKQDFSTNFAK